MLMITMMPLQTGILIPVIMADVYNSEDDAVNGDASSDNSEDDAINGNTGIDGLVLTKQEPIILVQIMPMMILIPLRLMILMTVLITMVTLMIQTISMKPLFCLVWSNAALLN